MAYNKQKLLRFKETILKDIDFKIMKIREETENREKNELKTLKNEKLNELFISIQENVKNIKLNFEQKLCKEILKIRNEILTLRNSLIEKFKKNCENELREFTKSPNYETYLTETIKNSCKNLNLEKTKLKLKRSDLKIKNKILNIMNFSLIEADDSIQIGGFKLILTDKKILIDKTLSNLLESEIKNFNKNYKLKLNISENISKKE